MAQDQRERENPPPRKWVRIIYRLMAAGQYAVLWLPELLRLYELYLNDEGEKAANEWLVQELLHSIGPSIAVRAYRIFRIFYAAWKVYRKLAGG